jgi:hypothetical protein
MSSEISVTQEQMFVIGIVVSVILFFLNELAKRNGIQIKRAWLTVGLYIVSFALAVGFMQPSVPGLPTWAGDPAVNVGLAVSWLGELLANLTVYVGFASVIYNIVGKRVLEGVSTQLFGPPSTEVIG